MTLFDSEALGMHLVMCSTLDEVLQVCEGAVQRGFDPRLLGDLLANAARRHFDRYFIFDQAAASARHRWDAAWPRAGAAQEIGQSDRLVENLPCHSRALELPPPPSPPVELREDYQP